MCEIGKVVKVVANEPAPIPVRRIVPRKAPIPAVPFDMPVKVPVRVKR